MSVDPEQGRDSAGAPLWWSELCASPTCPIRKTLAGTVVKLPVPEPLVAVHLHAQAYGGHHTLTAFLTGPGAARERELANRHAELGEGALVMARRLFVKAREERDQARAERDQARAAHR